MPNARSVTRLNLDRSVLCCRSTGTQIKAGSTEILARESHPGRRLENFQLVRAGANLRTTAQGTRYEPGEGIPSHDNNDGEFDRVVELTISS